MIDKLLPHVSNWHTKLREKAIRGNIHRAETHLNLALGELATIEEPSPFNAQVRMAIRATLADLARYKWKRGMITDVRAGISKAVRG